MFPILLFGKKYDFTTVEQYELILENKAFQVPAKITVKTDLLIPMFQFVQTSIGILIF